VISKYNVLVPDTTVVSTLPITESMSFMT